MLRGSEHSLIRQSVSGATLGGLSALRAATLVSTISAVVSMTFSAIWAATLTPISKRTVTASHRATSRVETRRERVSSLSREAAR